MYVEIMCMKNIEYIIVSFRVSEKMNYSNHIMVTKMFLYWLLISNQVITCNFFTLIWLIDI